MSGLGGDNVAVDLDSNFAELQAINKVINLGNNDFLAKNNIDHTYFHDPICIEAYKWIEVFIDKYNKIPDYSSFYSHFPDLEHYASQGVKESAEHIVESIKEYHLFYKLKTILTEASNKAVENANDSYDYLLSKVNQLSEERPVAYYNIIDQAKVRFDDWNNQVSGNPKEFLSTGFPELDHKVVGLSPGEELVVLFARTGVGKEQPFYSKVLTPTGFKQMQHLKIGEKVIVSNGDIAHISGIFPQGKKDIYRVYLADGSYADCGLEHLWQVSYNSNGSELDVVTTQDIIDNLKDKHYYICKGSPANISSTNYNLDPYVVGFLLGNSRFSVSDLSNDFIRFQCRNKHIANKIIASLVKCKINFDPINYEYILTDLDNIQTAQFSNMIKSRKNILYQPISFRKRCLLGILRSGNCIFRENITKYYPNSISVRDVVIQLCYSLGIKCDQNEFQLKLSVNDEFFYSEDNSLNSFEKIVRVEKIGKSYCQCIMVDHPLHTYITDNYIVTHNTWILMNALHEAWKRGMDVGIIEPEMTGPKLGYRFDTLDNHISNSNLTYGKVDKIDKVKYKEYAEDMSQRAAKFISAHPRDFGSSGLTVSKIRNFCKQTKIKILGIDGISYIKDERGKPSDSTTTTLTNISEDLMDLSIDLGIPIIIVVQSNREGDALHGGKLGLENIRGSDGIAYSASMIFGLYKSSSDVLRIQILKNRNGPTGITLAYNWNIDEGRFSYLGEGDEDEITGEASENSYQPPQKNRRDRSQDIDYSSNMNPVEFNSPEEAF